MTLAHQHGIVMTKVRNTPSRGLHHTHDGVETHSLFIPGNSRLRFSEASVAVVVLPLGQLQVLELEEAPRTLTDGEWSSIKARPSGCAQS